MSVSQPAEKKLVRSLGTEYLYSQNFSDPGQSQSVTLVSSTPVDFYLTSIRNAIIGQSGSVTWLASLAVNGSDLLQFVFDVPSGGISNFFRELTIPVFIPAGSSIIYNQGVSTGGNGTNGRVGVYLIPTSLLTYTIK